MISEVSILVPIYNASNYIEKCIHSLFQQTFLNIEYVFVNDGSLDDSISKLRMLIEQYPQKKENIKIIELDRNRGVSFARKTAIEHSCGKYLIFIDADDYIELNMIELLYAKIEETSADVAVCDMINEYTDHSTVVYEDFVSDNKDENFHNMLLGKKTISVLWNKLIKRELYELEECQLPEYLNSLEDSHVIIRIYYNAVKIVKVNEVLYHYVHSNPNSITKTIERVHFENLLLFWKLLDQFITEKNIKNYTSSIEYLKVKDKIQLMIAAKFFQFSREYAWIFHDFEMKYIHKFRKGEKIMLFLLHYKFFFFAQLFHKALRYKNRKYRSK